MKCNWTELQKLYNNDQMAAEFLSYLANKKNFNISKVTEACDNLASKPCRRDVVRIFKDLEKTGVGVYITRKEGPSRFEWYFLSSEIGQFASGEDYVIPHEIPADLLGVDNEGKSVKHTFKLRSDLSVVLNLPTDLTHSEATRLSKWLEAIPMT